jgi:tRNA 2-thiouridine synthesizing protein E
MAGTKRGIEMEQNGETTSIPGLNVEGFLTGDSGWNEEIAKKLAQLNDIWPLTEEHWNVINFVRRYFEEYGQGPMVLKIAQATGLSSKQICELFPCGVVRGAYRIAGLPRPPGCI